MSVDSAEKNLTVLTSQITPHLKRPKVDTASVTDDKIEFKADELDELVPLQKMYDIVKQIAAGGQGIISTGRDKILQRSVAVKSLKTDYLTNKQVVKHFVTEAKITAQLDHPSIVPLYSINSSDDDKGLHISMKLIHGHNLKELIEDTVLLCKQYSRRNIREIEQSVLKERLDDFVKVCDAISFAHNKKVIHCDLKPDNIMVGEFHEVYVMDWGIATLYNSGTDRKKESGNKKISPIAGTPGYIAPEVVVGGKLTPACDQYALGMILFELVTLNSGITGETVKELFEKTRDGELEPIVHRFHQCRVSGELKAVIRKATALNPEERYSSVAALAEDIRRYLKNDELKAAPDSFPRKIFRWIGKHKNLATSFLLLFLLGCAGVTIYSLVKRNLAEKESKHRALKMITLHSAIESNAHFIDRHLLHIAHLLSRFTEKTTNALEGDKYGADSSFVPTSAFKNRSDFPPGTLFSPAYKSDINLDVINYSLPPNLKLSDVRSQLAKIATIRGDMFRYLSNSDLDAMVLRNVAKGRQRAFGTGFPIHWLSIGLKDGLMVSYPGSGGLPDGYDPRTRPWYRNAEREYRQNWSRPYIDMSGLGVIISLSQAMHDSNDRFLGVVAFDLTFDYISRTLMSTEDRNRSVIARYLINAEGDIILSSRIALNQINKAEKNASEIKFSPFPYPEIMQHIRKEKSGQFEINNNGRMILIGYAPVETLKWYYVEEVNLKRYLKEDKK